MFQRFNCGGAITTANTVYNIKFCNINHKSYLLTEVRHRQIRIAARVEATQKQWPRKNHHSLAKLAYAAQFY